MVKKGASFVGGAILHTYCEQNIVIEIPVANSPI